VRLIVVAFAAVTASAQAMEFRIAGNELHLRGKVEGYEYNLFKQVLAENAGIDTVVFGASPGGYSWSAFRVGEAIRDAGLRTVLAGPCLSACAIMFLGGRTRHFIQVTRPEFLYLAFHGSFVSHLFDRDTPSQQDRLELRAWIVERTGGKIDPVLLDRFIGTQVHSALLYVYDPRQLARQDGVSLFFCEGIEKGTKPFEACDGIPGHNAFTLGLVNSVERVRVTPFQELPPPFKPKSVPYPWPRERSD
jgi:hypothetical protein